MDEYSKSRKYIQQRTLRLHPIYLGLLLILGGLEIASADELKVMRSRGPAFGDQTNVERKESVPGQTNEQRQRLDLLAYEIFEPPVPTLEYQYVRVSANALFKRFGKPKITSEALERHRDPNPGAPAMIEALTWDFSGMVMDVTAYPPSVNHDPKKISINRIEITSSRYQLQNRLEVGQPISKFISQLGNPNSRDKSSMSYLVEDHKETGPSVYEVTAYQIEMALDEDDIVRRITWTWGME